MENSKESGKIRKIAEELIENCPEFEHVRNNNIRIAYLESDKNKKKQGFLVFGQCEKVAERHKWLYDCDFTITIYSLNVALLGFTDEQLKVLVYHELLHVGVRFSAKGDPSYYCVPHDVQEFRLVIDRFGLDWQENNQLEFNFDDDGEKNE